MTTRECCPAQIGGIKCHGTATKYNDAMEAKAITSLFGEEIPPCFSIKGAIGHTSGAGSLLEICVAAECLRRRLAPPTAGFSTLGVDEPVPVSAVAADSLDKHHALPLRRVRRHKRGSRAFGGAMSDAIYVESFSSLTAGGIAGPAGIRAWDRGQNGPQDVRRDQVLDKPYVNFGKLMLPDRLAFGAASVALSNCTMANPETTAITIGICAGSLSTDLRYMESVLAGFPSPAIFSATLPSSAITDIAIYFGIKGPNRVVAGNGASGLSALDLACTILACGKASAALWLCVNAVETQDAGIPLLDESVRTRMQRLCDVPCRPAPARRLGHPPFGIVRTGHRQGSPSRDELYFTELFMLLHGRKNGSVNAASCDLAATLSLAKEA